ncbi:MAG TPA: formimidoylglutamase [Parasegetibacter sp.]|jgi:formiminoglutamase
MLHFKFYSKEDILSLTKLRRFETKIGERVRCLAAKDDWEIALQNSSVQYVLFGIPEDIGVKANYGVGGTDSCWTPFLSSFLNTQSNDFFSGEEILLLGHFDFGDLKFLVENNASRPEEKIDAYRHAVYRIDEEVETIAKIITAAGKIPVVVGGGHNNAYPLVKGTAKGWHKRGVTPLAQINVINLDAHSDYRPIEGRHSGNGFRYADEDGYLQKYSVIGLHEMYLPQNVWMDLVNNPFIDFITYEEIFIHAKKNFTQAVAHSTEFTEDTLTGIELDLDAVQNVLSSACTPTGVSPLHARQYMNYTATHCDVAYLHICEGACHLTDGRKDDQTGKLISYLVSDFLKAHIIARQLDIRK